MLTDMETCYKVMREVLRSMTPESNGFGIEPELTAKIFGTTASTSSDYLRRAATTKGRRSRGATASSRCGCC